MPSYPVLIVEDKDALRAMFRRALEAQGHTVVEAADEPSGRQQLAETRPAAVLTDLRLPNGSGFGVLRAARELDPEMQVIVMTGAASVQDAVTAMREGAADFLAKPVDTDHLLLMVERAIAQRRLRADYFLAKEELAARRGAPRIIGQHPSLMKALDQLHRAAATETTVLLLGESGTGKELFARALHALSVRSDGPFVALNCAAIPESLLESELFGHEKGAFTGAGVRKPGRFELAHRGTLFLDEVGELPLTVQAKLLRVLEDRSFQRLGGTETMRVDTRLVAATNRNLKQRVADRYFRQDLFFRLSVFPIEVPALRERGTDVLILARHFLERFCGELNKPGVTLSPDASDALLAYRWPGNVRELQNSIERAVILCEGGILTPQHFNLPGRSAATPPTSDPWDAGDRSESLADFMRRATADAERHALVRALRDACGNRQEAAERLQIAARLLDQKLREHGL